MCAVSNLGQIQALVVQSSTPTSTNEKKMLWFDTTNNVIKYWKIDESKWVELTANVDKHLYHSKTFSKEWIWQHNMGKRPAVTVVDNVGKEVGASIQHNDINKLTVKFNTAMAGYLIGN